MKEIIGKYLVDILILGGIWIFFYAIYFSISGGYGLPPIELGYDYSNDFQFLGIVLVTLGADVAIRRYIKSRKLP